MTDFFFSIVAFLTEWIHYFVARVYNFQPLLTRTEVSINIKSNFTLLSFFFLFFNNIIILFIKYCFAFLSIFIAFWFSNKHILPNSDKKIKFHNLKTSSKWCLNKELTIDSSFRFTTHKKFQHWTSSNKMLITTSS